jgi:hypothetical protein
MAPQSRASRNSSTFDSPREGANSHIWHRAPRHADSIAAGLTSAGCKCQANCTHRGKALSGCANPSYTPNPLLDTSAHGEKREA